ncbi:unnamed protein product [Blepharisma stoltei]|uniref:UBC core domain-containing protein n=1 Tax=Blepharisma stoltei TaxID=1481888 RepID=A0AAU9IJ39_9CILI|nr:unnamed protein product [Blepharisma stoltei]
MDAEVIGSQNPEPIEAESAPVEASSSQQDTPSLESVFKENFKDRLFFLDNLKAVTSFTEQSQGIVDGLATRLNKEIKVLTRGLPCEIASSIFVAIDSNDFRCMEGIIAGSSGTPYAHGLYFFDISIGNDYPSSPPLFTLKTTGSGQAYFGPNLYSSGYVCLSIINTWSGDPEEMWTPNKNILQVLLSIQGLVMDDHILQKEPGWDCYDVNCVDSIIYQNAVKYLNIKYAMIENMRNPTKGFEKLIENYFRIKHDVILKEVNEWLVKAKSETIDYASGESMASNYNPTLCQEMAFEGFYKVLSRVAKELKEEFDNRYGVSDTQLDLWIEENTQLAIETPNTEEVQENEIAIQDAYQNPPVLSPMLLPETQPADIIPLAFISKEEQVSMELVPEQQLDYVPSDDLKILDNYAEEQVSEQFMQVEPVPVLFREPSSSDPEAPESTHIYFQELGNLRLQFLEESEANFINYMYDRESIGDIGLARINKEIKALTRSLPCEPSGSIFVAVNQSNLSMINVLISGTEDTPYDHGLFLFDLKLPQDYPSNPPQMNIKTTGYGTLRFNPNLYDSGYVCLSIINTWEGDPEEKWNPTYSTLLQVFLSIQALVMNNDVLQKEPGYEGYDSDYMDNLQYRAIVTYGNIKYAMTDMIRNPPAEFKDIIRKHFLLKKDKILETVEKWKQEALKIEMPIVNDIVLAHNPTTIQEFSSTGIAECFDRAIEELKAELINLK